MLFLFLLLGGCSSGGKDAVTAYEREHYNESIKTYPSFAETLCVTDTDIDADGYSKDSSIKAAGLFDVNGCEVLYSNSVHKKLYPASTTKIMTALLALKYGNLEDTVTVSKNATVFEADASLCGLAVGDTISLEDLLYGLMLESGNDAAVAIAEHISGSVEDFAVLMNQEAQELGATNTHFVNPHGLHDDNHYTTAYDLYLIFNECIKNDKFVEIVNAKSHEGTMTGNGTKRKVVWKPTNFYFQGTTPMPGNVTMVGGKTGYTGKAGACLIFLERDQEDNPYISVIMGAGSKPILYSNMTSLIQTIE